MENKSWWVASLYPPQDRRDPELFKEIDETAFLRAVRDALLVHIFVEQPHYQLIDSNHQTLRNTFVQAKATGITDDPSVAKSRQLQLSLGMFNWLLSFRAFLDHLDTHVSEVFGKKSKERALLRDRTVAAHDSHFGYRFLFRLRHYVQHCGFPPVRVRYDGTQSPPVEFVGLDRDRLLDRSDIWGAIVRPELEELPRLFNVEPFFDEAKMCVDEIHKIIRKLERSEFDAAARRMRVLQGAAADRGGRPAVAERMEMENSAKVVIHQMPIRLLDEAIA